MNLTNKFWDKVDKSGNCWLWMGYRRYDGYGQFRFEGQMRGTHRLVWREANGDIPKGMQVCHTCDNPPCVNLKHLWLGTCRDNQLDARSKGRSRTNPKRGETHGMSKLTWAAVKEIRETYNPPWVTRKYLAAKFGVARTTIERARAGQSWNLQRGQESK